MLLKTSEKLSVNIDYVYYLMIKVYNSKSDPKTLSL